MRSTEPFYFHCIKLVISGNTNNKNDTIYKNDTIFFHEFYYENKILRYDTVD